MCFQVDSTNATFYDEMKENLTHQFHLIGDLDIHGQGQANWNWTTVVPVDQQQ